MYAVQIQRREYRERPMNGQRPLHFLEEAIPGCIYIKFSHRANNRSKYVDGFYHSMIDDNVIHIPHHSSGLPAPHCAMLSWSGKRTKVFIRKRPRPSRKRTDLIARTTSTARIMVVRMHPAALQLVRSHLPRLVLQTRIYSS